MNPRWSWKKRRDMVYAAILGAIGLFIVWTSLSPRRPDAWSAAGRVAPPVPTRLDVPTLLLILVIVLVLWGVSRSNRSRLL